MRWTIQGVDSKKVQQLVTVLQVDELVARLLVQRGVETFEEAKTFFRPSLEHLHDPYLMKDMDKAVERIERAIANQENILVFGDYDVDGTTAVSLVSSYLRTYYDQVTTYIPDRYTEGYGVSKKGIDYAADNECKLIIALDCGIKSIELVAYAKSLGVDFIICDHHLPGDQIPEAVAVLDPKRQDCNYPYDELCGCGVGFKLIQALGQNRGQNIDDLTSYLDLVAVAIGADIVPIDGENRVLAYYGMEVINKFPRVSITALFGEHRKTTYDISDVVFTVAPRINAAGRIENGNYAVDLLTETDAKIALQKAQEIELFNTERKDLDKTITEEALLQIKINKEQDNATTVVYKETWHKGVIGIVASRLIETYHRPTLVFTKSGDYLAASARSVPGFDVYKAIETCQEHLIQFGGHVAAAGLTLEPRNYQKFKDKFEEVVAATISDACDVEEVKIDAEISLSKINPKFIRILKQFAPFGPKNRTPVFLTHNLKDMGCAKQIGSDLSHLSLNVTDGERTFKAIAFGKGEQLATVKKGSFSAVYCIDENEWRGDVSVQLRVKDLR